MHPNPENAQNSISYPGLNLIKSKQNRILQKMFDTKTLKYSNELGLFSSRFET